VQAAFVFIGKMHLEVGQGLLRRRFVFSSPVNAEGKEASVAQLQHAARQQSEADIILRLSSSPPPHSF